MFRNKNLIPACWLLLLCLPGIAQASRYDDRLDFSLALGSTTTHWVYQGTARETQLRSVIVSWVQPLSRSMRGGLYVSYLDTSQISNPHDAGLDTAGDALGIDLQFDLIDTTRFDLGLRFAYDYARTESSLGNQQLENNWSTASLGLDASLNVARHMDVLAGGGLLSVDGEERLHGDVNQITPFHEETSEFYYAGLRIRTDSRDLVGLRLEGGYQTGVFLSFTHQY